MFNRIAHYVIVLMILISSVIGLSLFPKFESASAAPQVEGDIYIQDTIDDLTVEEKRMDYQFSKKT